MKKNVNHIHYMTEICRQFEFDYVVITFKCKVCKTRIKVSIDGVGDSAGRLNIANIEVKE